MANKRERDIRQAKIGTREAQWLTRDVLNMEAQWCDYVIAER